MFEFGVIYKESSLSCVIPTNTKTELPLNYANVLALIPVQAGSRQCRKCLAMQCKSNYCINTI